LSGTGSAAATCGCGLRICGLGLGFVDRDLGLGVGLGSCVHVNITAYKPLSVFKHWNSLSRRITCMSFAACLSPVVYFEFRVGIMVRVRVSVTCRNDVSNTRFKDVIDFLCLNTDSDR